MIASGARPRPLQARRRVVRSGTRRRRGEPPRTGRTVARARVDQPDVGETGATTGCADARALGRLSTGATQEEGVRPREHPPPIVGSEVSGEGLREALHASTGQTARSSCCGRSAPASPRARTAVPRDTAVPAPRRHDTRRRRSGRCRSTRARVQQVEPRAVPARRPTPEAVDERGQQRGSSTIASRATKQGRARTVPARGSAERICREKQHDRVRRSRQAG